ncbi:MAG: thioredoxin domain-containing protein [Acidobacteria bacterium]|nr:thioredoxin domain-containing protein [Acidobacteriota bacterium]
MSNRLARERSPYLLQHAHNPVDWYPWGNEAFERARKEDKPIFLSIGYSTCHWCHVMERESFEDEAVAKLLNEHFVAIKVDREERPDVDRVYMMFVQATTGAGGWPLSVWLTPDLKPFFGGTYFPPESKWGRPGFVDVLEQLARAWQTERLEVVTSAQNVLDRLRQATGADDAAPDSAPVAGREALDAGIASFAQSFDARHGGFGGAPKFPRPSELLFLLRAGAFTGERRAWTMALDTLRAMADGGIRDHIGGGFHRYSVDAEWRVPHFEKMLYDQAQLVLAYLDGAQASGDAFYASVAEDTLDYVARDLTSPEGAFYSAEDADSLSPQAVGGSAGRGAIVLTDAALHAPPAEKREGAFYVWTAGEIQRLLAAEDAAIVSRRFGVEPGGNALADPQGEFEGQNIPYVAQSIEDVAVRAGVPVERATAALAHARQVLFDARATRPRPHLDDKIITAWNGLAIAAFARAARTLVDSPRRDEWRARAETAAAWIREHLWRQADRRLLRRYRDGEAAVDAFAEDYAYLVWGLLELFQATGRAAWLEWAIELTATETSLFLDTRDGGWFSTTGQDASVLLRLKEDYDGAEPSAQSATVQNLLALGHLVGDAAYIDRARRTLERYGPEIGRVVRVMPMMVSNLVLWHSPATQAVLVASHDGSDGLRPLEQVAARYYVPASIVIPVSDAAEQAALGRRLPWLAAMQPVDGRAAAYVCHDFTCRAPVTDPAELDRQVREIAAPHRIV